VLTRAIIAVALVVASGMYARGAAGPEHPAPRIPLAALPLVLEDWHGREAPPLADDVLAQLGVDDYVNRHYAAAGAAPIAVYVGYYASQRQGDTIHSPQNCLPGAGWQPVVLDRIRLSLGGDTVPVNRSVIQKGMDRQAVFYWYQGRGRILANEFANKGWLMLDAARLRRTDGGLVRLITPITSSSDEAFRTLTGFTAMLVPQLRSHLP
jgi:EpsI family protein